MSKILDFSDMLITKFCHDISGGVGAVNNGVEFIEDPETDKEMRDKAFELISSNGKDAANKLKFFRYIYGVSSSLGETDLNEIKEISGEFFNSLNIKLEWVEDHSIENAVTLTHREAKLLFNMVFALSNALISGGNIKIHLIKTESGKNIIINGTGDKVKNIDDIQHILGNHELRDIKINNVQFHLTSKLASDLEAMVTTTFSDNSLEMKAELSN